MSGSPNRHPAVAKALRTAFGTEALDAWTPLSGGFSGAWAWRIRVGGIAYHLKVATRRDELNDPRRAQTCLKLAAGACLAPRVRYADPDDGVVISDLVEARSLALDYAGTHAERVVELAQAARTLHAIEGFPPLVDYLDGLDALVGRAEASDVVPPGAFDAWPRLREACARLPPQPVSSHNDLNPNNLVYDGRRIWLVDWDAAFRADRYVDLAALANAFAPDPASEALFLRTYFGREATAGERARLHLFRQVSHVFHAAAFVIGATGRARVETLDGPDLAEIHQGLVLGEARLETPEGRLTYGLAHLRAALAGVAALAFETAARTAT